VELFAFAGNGLPIENRPLMKIVDQINLRFPKAISVAATSFDQTWKAKSERVSPRYTTVWRELVSVKCG